MLPPSKLKWTLLNNHSRNCLALSGILVSRDAKRASPAGVVFCNAVLKTQSDVEENGVKRRVVFEIPLVAAGEMANRLESLPLNTFAFFGGFLASQSQRRKVLVFHIQSIELLKGT